MSQYSSPEGVFFGSPVTFVGAVVFGCAADEAFFVVLLCANTGMAASATIATRSVYFIISAPLRKFNTENAECAELLCKCSLLWGNLGSPDYILTILGKSAVSGFLLVLLVLGGVNPIPKAFRSISTITSFGSAATSSVDR